MANTTIALRSSGTAAATPSLGVLANGELSINYADGIIYYKTASNTLGSIRTTQPAGLTTEVQFNDAGTFGSDAGLTYNKTTDTLTVTGGVNAGGVNLGSQIATVYSLANGTATVANTDYTTISATAGVYGNTSYLPVVTLTANGRVSAITNTAIAIDTAAITSGTLSVARGGTGVTTSTGSGAVVLNTSPTLSTPIVDRIDWPAVGYAPPSLTTRSSGTKLTLYPSLSSTSVDYALGINGGVLWSSIPAANTSYSFKWYGGESEIASLSGSGEFTTITSNVISTTASTSNTTGALKVAGGIGVKGNVSVDGIIFADGTRQTTAVAGTPATLGDVLALSIALG
jgi:hypothetical protein